MIRKGFNWFVLSCFIMHVALYFSTSHFAGKSMAQLEELLEGHGDEGELAAEDSPIDLMLLEYLDLIEDFPRTDTSKPNHKGANSVYQTSIKPVLQKSANAFLQAEYHIAYTCAPYRPLNFLLSEYHGYLFRLTPF